jgi:hypothetical protein
MNSGLADDEALESVAIYKIGCPSGRPPSGPRRILGCRLGLLDGKRLLGRGPLAHPERRLGAVPKDGAVDTVDQVSVFVLDPSEMELGRCDEDQAIPIDVGLETGQPGVPIRLRDSGTQGVAEVTPQVICSFGLRHLAATPPGTEFVHRTVHICGNLCAHPPALCLLVGPGSCRCHPATTGKCRHSRVSRASIGLRQGRVKSARIVVVEEPEPDFPQQSPR